MTWRRTPRWIALGGAALAATAGYVNATGYLGTAHRGLTHVTGQVTQLGIDLVLHDVASTLHVGSLVVAFIFGAMLSGALIRSTELTDAEQERYGVVLFLEAVLLGVAAVTRAVDVGPSELLVAAAMGLQNAMATTYSGAIVRTTHMTGIATDLGITFGRALRGRPTDRARLKLLSSLLGAFVAGGILGAAVHGALGRLALAPPAVALAVAAIFWVWLARSRSR